MNYARPTTWIERGHLILRQKTNISISIFSIIDLSYCGVTCFCATYIFKFTCSSMSFPWYYIVIFRSGSGIISYFVFSLSLCIFMKFDCQWWNWFPGTFPVTIWRFYLENGWFQAEQRDFIGYFKTQGGNLEKTWLFCAGKVENFAELAGAHQQERGHKIWHTFLTFL